MNINGSFILSFPELKCVFLQLRAHIPILETPDFTDQERVRHTKTWCESCPLNCPNRFTYCLPQCFLKWNPGATCIKSTCRFPVSIPA